MLIKQVCQKNDICHYWYFKDVDFKYEKYLCNGCHDLMQKAMSFNNVVIAYVKEGAYRIHFWYTSKDHAVNIMNSCNLVDKSGVLSIFFIFYFLLYIKMSENTYLTFSQKNK